MEATKLKTDLRVILINETQHWSKDLQEKAGTIKTAYLYDNSVDTFACEIKASKWCEPLYVVTENEVSEEIQEELDMGFFQCNEGIYVSLLPEDQREEVKLNEICKDQFAIDFDYSEDEDYKENWEEAMEYCSANHLI